MGLAAAVVGAGLGAGASIATGAMNSSAVNNASEAQVAENQQALALQQGMFNQTQANLQPYMAGGRGALSSYQDLIGANGSAAQQAAISGLSSNPLYTAEMGAGSQAILANAAATGGLRSGNANYGLGQLGAQTLAQVYQQQIGNLGNLAGIGENAAAGVGNLGAQYAGLGTGTLGNIGSAQAGGILGSTGALTSGINGGISSLLGGLGSANALGLFGPGALSSPAISVTPWGGGAPISSSGVDLGSVSAAGLPNLVV